MKTQFQINSNTNKDAVQPNINVTKDAVQPKLNKNEDAVQENIIPNEVTTFENKIEIEPRVEHVFKLKCTNLKDTDAICPSFEIENVKIASSLVKINSNGEFFTTIINPTNETKQVNFKTLKLESFNAENILNYSQNENNSKFEIDREYQVKNQLRLNHLNKEKRDAIIKICFEFLDIFYLEGDKLTFTNQIKHEIQTGDAKPIFTKSYRYPYVHKEEVKSQIKKMLDQNIIQPSTSPWSSPVWVVPKKLDASGKQKWRVVIDYRKLNEVTLHFKWPLPNITDLLDQLGKCEYFTTLDLANGFHQIEIEPRDIPKTAFSVKNGHYEFIRMPFGLKCAPMTFQRVMDNVLSGLQGERCLVYMDDK